MTETEYKEKLYAAELAFERRLGIMEVKISQDLIKERGLREVAEKNWKEEKELREKQVAAAAEDKTKAIAAAIQELEKELNNEKTRNIALNKQIESMKMAYETEKQALELEADQEVVSAKTEADTLLTAERATVQKLRGEAVILKQRYEDQIHTAKFAESNAQKSSQEAKKLRAQVEGLSKDLAGVRSELTARESALQDKESMIREVTERERALEIKCAALVEARNAAERDAAAERIKAGNLAQQVESLRGEYRSAQKALKAAELASSSRKQREIAARKETAAQKEIAERLSRKLKTVSGAIAEAVALIQKPAELKNAVVQLYQAYAEDIYGINQENTCVRGSEEEGVAANEKRDLLIQRLQRQLQEQRENNVAESRRAVSENAFLMKEIELLEKKLESYQNKIC
jgi:hypothetical protein